MHNGLSCLAARSGVVFDPLSRPFDGLGPPVRVGMEDAEVNVLERKFLVEVAAVVAVVEAIGGGFVVEAAFAAPGNHVVWINRLDECAHFVDPGRDSVGCAGTAARKVAYTVCAAAWLVCQFPGEDAGGVCVALDDLTYVVLVCGFDFGVAVELNTR
jgi:hypothetical protein